MVRLELTKEEFELVRLSVAMSLNTFLNNPSSTAHIPVLKSLIVKFTEKLKEE